jgi:hypothetical protein
VRCEKNFAYADGWAMIVGSFFINGMNCSILRNPNLEGIDNLRTIYCKFSQYRAPSGENIALLFVKNCLFNVAWGRYDGASNVVELGYG